MNDATSIGELIDALELAKSEQDALNSQLSDVKQEIAELDKQIKIKMKDENMTRAAGSGMSVSITETIVPNIKDWDEFLQDIIATDRLYLIQRRVNSRPFRDLVASDEVPKGLEPFTKISLSTRTLAN